MAFFELLELSIERSQLKMQPLDLGIVFVRSMRPPNSLCSHGISPIWSRRREGTLWRPDEGFSPLLCWFSFSFGSSPLQPGVVNAEGEKTSARQ
jgi:hypothetical protein